MSSIMFIVVFFAQSFHIIHASYPFFGKCLQHPVVKNFNMTRYAGTWYEIEKYFSFEDARSTCTTIVYQVETFKDKSEENETEFLSFLKKSKRISVGKNAPKTGKVVFSNNKKSGHLAIAHKSSNLGEKSKNRSLVLDDAYWVLGTDYDSYSVVWSCKNAGIMNFQNVIFLSRDRDPSNLIRGKAYGVIKRHGLSTKILVSTDQSDCPNLFPTKPKLVN